MQALVLSSMDLVSLVTSGHIISCNVTEVIILIRVSYFALKSCVGHTKLSVYSNYFEDKI